jgi:hypothetical protein
VPRDNLKEPCQAPRDQAYNRRDQRQGASQFARTLSAPVFFGGKGGRLCEARPARHGEARHGKHVMHQHVMHHAVMPLSTLLQVSLRDFFCLVFYISGFAKAHQARRVCSGTQKGS